ncbi:MAG: hypothetical protein MJ237_04230 [bacterium]|nr:hypothetical protein [bacterium]
MRVLSIANQTSFKSLQIAQENFSPSQQATIEDITAKVKDTTDKCYRKTTAENWLQKRGYDIYLKSGKQLDSICVNITERNSGNLDLPKKNLISLGEYTGNDFDTRIFKDDYREGAVIYSLFFVPILMFAIAMGNKACQKFKYNKANHIENHITIDSIINKAAAPFRNIGR